MAENLPEKSEVAKREEAILKFWRDNKIFERTLKKEAPKGEYVFYDGPPFATGLPHYGHILASAIKDAVPRYQTMRGFRVNRRWGWDCHGLPVENIVEKELKISGKKEIEKIGIDKFNEMAKSKVLTYVNEWKKTVERIGRWVDFDGSYKTMDNTYMESVWWALSEINKKGLLYESTRVLPYCPRCETPIANAEIAMDNSYKNISDLSVFVKFKVVDSAAGRFFQVLGNNPQIMKKASSVSVSLLAWTTTPWTLPGNVALAVGPEIPYVGVKVSGTEEILILAKSRLEVLKDLPYETVAEFLGKDLIGLKYQALFDYYLKEGQVYGADFVTTEDGVGIVHIAPAFGEDDMKLAQKEKLPVVIHVDSTGHFKPEVKDFAGQAVKPKSDDEKTRMQADINVIKYLQYKQLYFDKKKIIHSYPHCFRCETPLYYYAIPAWFIKIQELKPRLQELNQQINWIPEHLKLGRFAKSMEGAPDWNISRNRFWATPLPIWKCGQCAQVKVVGSLQELTAARQPSNQYWIMRHGEAESNVRQIVSGKVPGEYHLTDLGREQVVTTAAKLKSEGIDIIIASPVLRTRETAELVAEKLGLAKEQIIFDERLREVAFGDLEGESVAKYHAGPAANGETMPAVRARAMQALYELDAEYVGKKILLVTHEAVVCLIKEVEAFPTGEASALPFVPLPHNANFELDLHRPYIDEVKLKCGCGGEMKRIPEVIDCWFESGSMPFASEHYHFENKERALKRLPADFVAEYIAQTRTWFYYMHAVSTILFDKIPFKNVVTTGTVLAEDGQKMSKSKGNFPDPWIIFNQYGVDALRFYLLSSPIMKSEDLNFSEKGVGEVYRKIISRLWNVYTFYEMYAGEHQPNNQDSGNVLDRWIIARLNQVLTQVTTAMDRYELDCALRPMDLLVDDLSTWYLRRSRDRFKSNDAQDKQAAMNTIREVLLTLAQVMAPFTPFIAEDIYRKLNGGKESVHLCEWPYFAEASRGKPEVVLEEMAKTRLLVSQGLELRAKANIKVRQPLASVTITENLPAEYLELIKDELNVEEVKVGEAFDLDTNLTPELKEKGEVRDLIREIQEWRKGQNLKPGELVAVPVSKPKQNLAEKYSEEIKSATSASGFNFVS